MKTTITTIMINTAEPEKLAEFWKALLGARESYKTDGFLWLRPAEGQPAIGFQKVSDADAMPQRVHIDILVDDKQAATKRVQELGGTLVQTSGINNIVADPAGNQFCVYVRE